MMVQQTTVVSGLFHLSRLHSNHQREYNTLENKWPLETAVIFMHHLS